MILFKLIDCTNYNQLPVTSIVTAVCAFRSVSTLDVSRRTLMRVMFLHLQFTQTYRACPMTYRLCVNSLRQQNCRKSEQYFT
jgi:hypothetical protein